ncbi:hypothetical protein RCS94_06435 [Orbaceae bacterium ac157xtp]
MTRKTKIITIETGRDAGKKFEITEPDAFTGEDIFLKLMSLCSVTGKVDQMVKQLTTTDEGRSVWKSLINLVKIIPSENSSLTRSIDKQDIEDFNTLIKLRTEALTLIMDFIQE